MSGVFLGILLAIPAVALLWWVIQEVFLPIRDFLRALHRLATGDFRPPLLGKTPWILRWGAADLRLIAEELLKQKNLLAREEFSIAVILESMDEGVIITGNDLRIRMVNNAATRMLNLSGELRGLLLPEVFRSHELHNIAQRVAQTGEFQRGELTAVVEGRAERAHLVITAATLASGETDAPDGLLLVFHDVTRMRELESVRREFVANVSHEFRTPLSIINGYLETMEEGGMGKEMTRKSIGVMRRHCLRLNLLLEDLLTISRMEEKGLKLETSPADVAALLRGTVQQLEKEIEQRGADVRLELDPSLPAIDADAYRLEQVFSNLLANALRHGAAEGGIIRISTSIMGGEMVISFKDNGPGISSQDQEHLFERFYRVGGDRARETGGTGLGLSIVKNIITAHRGRVSLESSPGAGSTFTVTLPLKYFPD
jgi:two-component system phosphate regulon sensor histidine kinase PhoR